MRSTTLLFALSCLIAFFIYHDVSHGAIVPSNVGQAAASNTATFLPLGDFEGIYFQSFANAVSADGSVVVGSGTSSDVEAFRWTEDSGLVGLGALISGHRSQAHGVSADGSVVVGDTGYGFGQAFRWTSGESMVGLGHLPGGFQSSALGVSADGSAIVGRSNSVNSDEGGTYSGLSEAFRWNSDDGMVGLGFLPGGITSSVARAVSADGSVVVGSSGSGSVDAGAQEAFRWTSDGGMVGLGDLPGGHVRSDAYDVSDDGAVIVGSSFSSFGFYEAFRWTSDGEMVGLGVLGGVPGAANSVAYGVSGDGSIVVGGSGYGTNRAFIWDEGNGMRDLQEILENDYGLDPGRLHRKLPAEKEFE
jgi:probable HAF family extracellular repeat protein